MDAPSDTHPIASGQGHKRPASALEQAPGADSPLESDLLDRIPAEYSDDDYPIVRRQRTDDGRQTVSADEVLRPAPRQNGSQRQQLVRSGSLSVTDQAATRLSAGGRTLDLASGVDSLALMIGAIGEHIAPGLCQDSGATARPGSEPSSACSTRARGRVIDLTDNDDAPDGTSHQSVDNPDCDDNDSGSEDCDDESDGNDDSMADFISDDSVSSDDDTAPRGHKGSARAATTREQMMDAGLALDRDCFRALLAYITRCALDPTFTVTLEQLVAGTPRRAQTLAMWNAPYRWAQQISEGARLRRQITDCAQTCLIMDMPKQRFVPPQKSSGAQVKCACCDRTDAGHAVSRQLCFVEGTQIGVANINACVQELVSLSSGTPSRPTLLPTAIVCGQAVIDYHFAYKFWIISAWQCIKALARRTGTPKQLALRIADGSESRLELACWKDFMAVRESAAKFAETAALLERQPFASSGRKK